MLSQADSRHKHALHNPSMMTLLRQDGLNDARTEPAAAFDTLIAVWMPLPMALVQALVDNSQAIKSPLGATPAGPHPHQQVSAPVAAAPLVLEAPVAAANAPAKKKRRAKVAMPTIARGPPR